MENVQYTLLPRARKAREYVFAPDKNVLRGFLFRVERV